jgi:uncharacterized protein
MLLKNKLRQFHDRFISLQGEPKAIAMGLAIGVFIGVTPTIPFHTALIILACLAFRQNVSAAYLGSWLVSNPVTIPILYYAQYELGAHLLGMDRDTFALADYSVSAILDMGAHILVPMLIGGLVMAPFFAIPAYFLTRRFIRIIRGKQTS